jgi:hypothetical protein
MFKKLYIPSTPVVEPKASELHLIEAPGRMVGAAESYTTPNKLAGNNDKVKFKTNTPPRGTNPNLD